MASIAPCSATSVPDSRRDTRFCRTGTRYSPGQWSGGVPRPAAGRLRAPNFHRLPSTMMAGAVVRDQAALGCPEICSARLVRLTCSRSLMSFVFHTRTVFWSIVTSAPPDERLSGVETSRNVLGRWNGGAVDRRYRPSSIHPLSGTGAVFTPSDAIPAAQRREELPPTRAFRRRAPDAFGAGPRASSDGSPRQCRRESSSATRPYGVRAGARDAAVFLENELTAGGRTQESGTSIGSPGWHSLKAAIG